MWAPFAALLCLFFALALAKTGDLNQSALVTAWLSPVILLACYFGSRNTRVAPTATERIIAKTWLLVRRALCFLGALLLGVAGMFGVHDAILKGSGVTLAGSVMALGLAGACAWWGIYGAGHDRSFRDDKPTHEERKRRYGWD